MEYVTLIIRPSDSREFKISLFSSGHDNEVSTAVIYSDQEYEFELDLENPRIERIKINKEDIQFDVYRGLISFKAPRKIFLDQYGYAQIRLKVNGEWYHSKQLPVLIRENTISDSISEMIDYISRHYPLLFFNNSILDLSLTDLNPTKLNDLERKIQLANKALTSFEQNFGAFKNGSHFKTEKEISTDQLSKAKIISDFSIRYISSHPEQLDSTVHPTAIRKNSRYLIPRKIAFEKDRISYDIPENHVLIDFLQQIILDFQIILQSLDRQFRPVFLNERYPNGYYNSVYYLFRTLVHQLDYYKKSMAGIIQKSEKLLLQYGNFFKLEPHPMKNVPWRTPLFRQNQLYSKVYDEIALWFSLEPYDFQREKLFMSYSRISLLYESFLLLQLINFFESQGFKRTEASCHHYHNTGYGYQQSITNNTYILEKGRDQLTIYYQPVIYNSPSYSDNGISLFRNDSNRLGAYYTPDFLIKINRDQKNYFILLDAKFSSKYTVENYKMQEMIRKYLLSVSPLHSQDRIIGLGILYGRADLEENKESFYINQPVLVFPFIEKIPFSASIDPTRLKSFLDSLYTQVFDYIDSQNI